MNISGLVWNEFLDDDEYWGYDDLYMDDWVIKINGKDYNKGSWEKNPMGKDPCIVGDVGDNDIIEIVDGYIVGTDYTLKDFFDKWRKENCPDESYIMVAVPKDKKGEFIEFTKSFEGAKIYS